MSADLSRANAGVDRPVCVRLDAAARHALEEALEAARGSEPCGYLLGEASQAAVRVFAVRAGRNVRAARAGSWALEPDEALAVRRAARAEGLAVVGYWHGHLVGPPQPGAADHAGRAPLGPHLHLICGRDPAGQVEIRAWLALSDGFIELPINAARGR